MLSGLLDYLQFIDLFARRCGSNLFPLNYILINTMDQTVRASRSSVASCIQVNRPVLNFACPRLSTMMQCCRNVPSCVRNAAGGGYRMASVSTSFFFFFSSFLHQPWLICFRNVKKKATILWLRCACARKKVSHCLPLLFPVRSSWHFFFLIS